MLLVFKALGSFRFHRSSGKRTLVYLCNGVMLCARITLHTKFICTEKILKKYNLNGAPLISYL